MKTKMKKPLTVDLGEYILYSDGKVWSKVSEQFLKYGDHHGYPTVQIRINGKRSPRLLHRLLALHFIPNPDNLPVVCHKNDVRSDYSLENLMWADQQLNMRLAVENKRFTYPRPWKQGEKNNRSRLTNDIVLSIREEFSKGLPMKSLSEKYKVELSHIYNIVSRKAWKHI